MHVLRKLGPEIGYLVFAAFFLCFILAFYFPLSSKAINNLYYAGLALPCLVWLLHRPRALRELVRPFGWLFVLLWLLVVHNSGEIAGLKKGVYLLLFFAACLVLWEKRWGVQACIMLFSAASVVMLAYVTVDWLWVWSQSGIWVRYDRLWGGAINPVYFSLLISNALVFLWLFYVEGWLARRSRLVLCGGLFVLSALVLLCSAVFQSRTTLLAYALFFCVYVLYRRLIMLGLLVMLVLIVVLFAFGGDELLLQRGLSYRAEIWQDAWQRLTSACSLWLGCGSDGYRFLGQFHHAHSGYVAMLYRNGLLGTGLFILFAAIFFWRGVRARSRWMLLALMGWGSLVTTTSGVLTTPQPLWVYFWLPTFMAILEGQREAVGAYFSARQS